MKALFLYSFEKSFYAALEFYLTPTNNEDITQVSDRAFNSTDRVIHSALENNRGCCYTEEESIELI